jgi:hypothetical protein
MDGKNYIPWKTVMPMVLDGEPYCWPVVHGDLNPPPPAKRDTAEGKQQMKNYQTGNRAGRYVLINSIHPGLAVKLFAYDANAVDAHEIWRRIKNKFEHESGQHKTLAFTKFMRYKYQPTLSVDENILRFTNIVQEMESIQSTVSEDVQITKLLDALPSSWEQFRQGWSARPDDERNLTKLITSIEGEAMRIGQSEVNEVTAMYSRLNIQRRNQFRRRTVRQSSNIQRTSQSSEVICYNCNQRGHIQSQCRAPRGPARRGRRPQRRSPPQANIVEALNVEAETDEPSVSEEFIADTGTTHNMIHNIKWMTDYRRFDKPTEVKLGGSRALSAQGSGTVQLSVMNNGRASTIILNDVLLVPKLRRNLISVGKMADDGFDIKITSEAIIMSQGDNVVCAERKNGLFVFSACEPVEVNVASANKKKKVSLTQAHKTFAHVNVNTVKEMLSREGFEIINDFVSCDVCTQGKMHRSSYRPKPRSVIAPRTGYIHADTCAISTTSYGGARYFLTLTDDMSRYRKIYCIQTKDQVADCI